MKFFFNIILIVFILSLFYITYNLKSYNIIKNIHNEKIYILDKPIVFDAQRKLLTALYREKHTSDCDHLIDGIDYCVNINPKVIVLHMTGLDSLEKSFAYMKEPVLRDERFNLERRSYDRLNVSAHFLVDVDGSIYRLMPENYMARHAMGLNHISIGIENVGLNGKETKAQVESSIKLINYLRNKFNIEKIISHSEISDLINSKYYIEKQDSYFREKDCGKTLAEKIRNLMYD